MVDLKYAMSHKNSSFTNQRETIHIFSPATVANVNCGFDSLGFALEGMGDEMVLKKIKDRGVTITKITGDSIPIETHKNVAGVAASAMLDYLKADFGIEIEIHKKIRSGSGIGSSSASAAGAVFGINQFLSSPLSNIELTQFAMKGEALASGLEHADNVAPCIYGGTTLITGYEPFKVIPLPPMDTVYVGILHPHIKIKTKEARGILPQKIPLKIAIKQSQRLAGFVASLYEWDKQLFAESIEDLLVEPYRKRLIPYFDKIKLVSKKHSCVAFGISGSGPSMFCFAFAKSHIDSYLLECKALYRDNGLEVDSYSSQISAKGCYVIK